MVINSFRSNFSFQIQNVGAPISCRLPCARHPVARILKSRLRTECPLADSAQNARAPSPEFDLPLFLGGLAVQISSSFATAKIISLRFLALPRRTQKVRAILYFVCHFELVLTCRPIRIQPEEIISGRAVIISSRSFSVASFETVSASGVAPDFQMAC
jgi:hypothetical protein